MCTFVDMADPELATQEISVRELRANLAFVLNSVAVRRQPVYVTSRGRRIAVVTPLPLDQDDQKSG